MSQSLLLPTSISLTIELSQYRFDWTRNVILLLLLNFRWRISNQSVRLWCFVLKVVVVRNILAGVGKLEVGMLGGDHESSCDLLDL